jgi:hypothetical protein
MKRFGAIGCMVLGVSTNDQQPAPQGLLTYDFLHEIPGSLTPGLPNMGQPDEND